MRSSVIAQTNCKGDQMSDDLADIKDKIIEAILPDIAFDGWTWRCVQAAAVKAGYDKDMANAVFPSELCDVLNHFSDWVDRQMMAQLSDIDPESLRIRDRIHEAVMTRIEVLEPHKEALKQAMSYWSLPHRAPRAGKIMWRTADRIWVWAGDTATDYNHYTKRGLLCGVMSSTILAWVNDDSDDMEAVEAFLDRRINNVLAIGKTIGRFKSKSAA